MPLPGVAGAGLPWLSRPVALDRTGKEFRR